MAVQTLIQVRRGTTSEWNSTNPVLSAGEWGLDTTTKRYKIGDGLTAWNSLPYASVLPNSNDLVGASGVGISFASTTGVPVSISVTGITTSQINDFDSAVDAKIEAAAVSVEQVQDIVASGDHVTTGFLRNGTGVVIDYNDASDFVTINVSGYALVDHSHSSGDITDFNTSVSGLLPSISGVSGVSVNFDNNLYTVSLNDPTIESADITDFVEAVQDVVGSGAGSTGFLRNGSGINAVYNDGDDTLTIGITGIPSSLITDFSDSVSDTVDTTLSAGTGISLSYDSGTNTLTIDTSGYSLLGHSHTWNDITDASSAATLNELAYLSGVVAGTASADRSVVLDSNKNISGIGNISTTGNITVGGDLIVNGTTTTVNSTEVNIGDNIITVNTSGLNTGGFRVYDGANYHSLIWNATAERWEFSGADVYTTGTIAANALEVSSTGLVSNLNSDLLDGEHGSYYRNFASLTGLPDPVITGNLTGDVTGSGSVTLTDLANGTLSISTTLADNTVTSAKIVDGTIVNADINDSAAIAVTKLASSGVTLGNTTINLGQTSSVIDGLTRISGVSAGSPVYIYYAVIDGGSP